MYKIYPQKGLAINVSVLAIAINFEIVHGQTLADRTNPGPSFQL